MDVRDEDAGRLLAGILEELRLLREQTASLLEAALRKLEEIERTR